MRTSSASLGNPAGADAAVVFTGWSPRGLRISQPPTAAPATTSATAPARTALFQPRSSCAGPEGENGGASFGGRVPGPAGMVGDSSGEPAAIVGGPSGLVPPGAWPRPYSCRPD